MTENESTNTEGLESTLIRNCYKHVSEKINSNIEEYTKWLSELEDKISKNTEFKTKDDTFNNVLENMKNIDSIIIEIQNMGKEHLKIIKDLQIKKKNIQNIKNSKKSFISAKESYSEQLKAYDFFNEDDFDVDETLEEADNNVEKIDEWIDSESNCDDPEKIKETVETMKKEIKNFIDSDYKWYLKNWDEEINSFWEAISNITEDIRSRNEKTKEQISQILKKEPNPEKEKLYYEILGKLQDKTRKEEEVEEEIGDEEDGKEDDGEEDKSIESYEYEDMEFDTDALENVLDINKELFEIEDEFKTLLYELINKEDFELYEKIFETVVANSGTRTRKHFFPSMDKLVELGIFNNYEEAEKKCSELAKKGLFNLSIYFYHDQTKS